MNILVKMDPSESTIFPDLVLTVPSALYQQQPDFYDKLRKGVGFDFEAVLLNMGNEFKMHHLQALEVKQNGKFKLLNDILVRESALP